MQAAHPKSRAGVERGDLRALALQWILWAALLASVRGLKDTYLHFAKPPEEAYAGPSLLLGALRFWPFLVVLVPLSILPLVRWRALRWRALPDGRALRLLVGAACLALAWEFSTYDTNLFFDQSHLLDRLLIVALALGVLLHPSLSPAFLAAALAMGVQFEQPFGGYSWTDKILPFEVLMVFVLFLQARSLFPATSSTFLLLVLAVVSAHYFYPGFNKLRESWPLREDLGNLCACARANGWFAGLGEEGFRRIALALRSLSPVLTTVAMGIELGAVLLLFFRRAYRVVLPACIALHLAIFVAAGIFFWMWIVVDVGLWFALGRLEPATREELHGWRLRALALFAVLTVNLWLDPMRLTWFDTPLSTTFELDATGASGRRYRVPRSSMTPHDLTFAQGRFAFLSEEPVLVGTCGTTQDYRLAQELARATPETIAQLEAAAPSRFDPARTEAFRRFLRAYFAAWNRGGKPEGFLDWIDAPHHIWLQSAGDGLYTGQEPVREVTVVRETRYWDGERFVPFSSRALFSVPIPGGP